MKDTALVGVGRWGKNVLRNLDHLSDVSVCCHKGEKENREFMEKNYPEIEMTTDLKDILEDDSIDAVAVATPPETHFDIVKQVLESGKDIYVEKPMTTSVEKSEKLVELSDKTGNTVFVGYIFLYHPVFNKVREIHKSEIITSIRAGWRKTGSFSDKITRTLTCHDLSIVYQLFQQTPEKCTVTSQHRTGDRTDILDVQLEFDKGKLHGSYNRIFPQKRKSMTFETQEGNFYNWTENTLSKFNEEDREFKVIFESTKEPLKQEIEAFLKCVEKGENPITDASFGNEIDLIINEIESQLH